MHQLGIFELECRVVFFDRYFIYWVALAMGNCGTVDVWAIQARFFEKVVDVCGLIHVDGQVAIRVCDVGEFDTQELGDWTIAFDLDFFLK